MKLTTYLTLRRLSIFAIPFLLSIAVLTAQVKINERVEINPRPNRTLQANANSSDLPCFSGEVVQGTDQQTIAVLRPCIITATGSVGCEVNVNLVPCVAGYDVKDIIKTFSANCGTIDVGAVGPFLSCGIIWPSTISVIGNIGTNSASFTIRGVWSCYVENGQGYHDITMTFNINASPIQEPSIMLMSATTTSLDAYEYGDAWANISATVCDGTGTPFSYCGPTTMVFTIENPIPGVSLNQNGTSVESSGTGNSVLFYWDKSDLPNGMDSVTLSIKAECLSLSESRNIVLKKIIPDHFTVTPDKDLINVGESASVLAIAKNSNDEEVSLNGGKSITFFDESGTGSFIVGSDTIPFEAIVTYDQAKSGSVKYYSKPGPSNLVDEQLVWIDVFRTDHTDRIGWGSIYVMPACPVVSLSPSKISPGDKTTVTVMAHTTTGNFPYPADQIFIASTDADARYGKLRCAGGEGTSISGTQPFEFIAADSIDVDSVVVNISAFPVSNGGGGGIGVGSVKNGQQDTLQRQAVLEKKIAPSQKGAVPIEGDTKNALTVLQASIMKKLAAEEDVLTQKIAKKQILMNAITEAIKTQKAGKGDTASAKQLNAMVKALTEGDQCQLFASVTIEKEDDKCPKGTACTSEPTLPKTSVAIKASGEILGETLSCLPDAKGRLPLAEFTPVSNSDKALEYDLNNVSVCCDQNSETWVIQTPPITFNSVIGLCENNLQNVTDLATINILMLSDRDKCVLKVQLKNGQNTEFRTMDGKKYYLKEATLTHEDVHRTDYEKNIADAVKKAFKDLPSSYFRIPKSECKTITEALEKAKKNVKGICEIILLFASDFRKDQIGEVDSPKREEYEQKTQANQRVQDIYTNFIETKLKYPSDADCKFKYGVN